ncbi:uncharacterized protein LOC133188032 [Saccostrea echinata]|uniref:uncharacterized protein LOC133188032 n=1 Tax=Saccostrea echinata TaxID=191078 RepID=UPI002A8100C6|nr:uncharacterized protein LOC133188032 [Saccostrea echinata]
MLIDTGSSVSLLSKEIYETLSFRPILTKVADKLTTADELGDLHGILGLDFLSDNEIVVDTCRGILMSSHFQIQLCWENSLNHTCARVQISENVRIPPRSEMFITGNVKGNISDDVTCILEPDRDQTGHDVLIPKSIVNITKSSVVFSVLNPTDNDIHLKKNKCIASIQAVDYIIDNDDCKGSGVENKDMSLQSSVPDNLQSLLENVSNKLLSLEKNELKHFVLQYFDVFVGSDGNLGRTDLTAHKIDTGGAKPIKLPPRRLPISQRDVAEHEIENMLQKGVIEPINSPWASPIVLVKKKDGSTRFA